MINIDLTDAYLMVPIHPNSQKFLRFLWQGNAHQFIIVSRVSNQLQKIKANSRPENSLFGDDHRFYNNAVHIVRGQINYS